MANFAHVENDNVVGLYDNLPKNWRNISNFYLLKDNVSYLNSLGWYVVTKTEPSYNPATQKLDNAYHWFENGVVYESYNVIDLPPPPSPPAPAPEPTAEQLAEIERQNLAMRWDEVRNQRDYLISQFEWRYLRYQRQVRLNITPTDNLQSLDQYVQSLADITLQEDPYNIIWPSYES